MTLITMITICSDEHIVLYKQSLTKLMSNKIFFFPSLEQFNIGGRYLAELSLELGHHIIIIVGQGDHRDDLIKKGVG